MCYDDNARPPVPPGESGAAHGEDVVLTSADGTQFMAYTALPAQTAHSHILIYPDVRGLHQFYKELALRFAEVGIAAIAMDYFGRTAGLSSRDEPFDFWPHVQQVRLPTLFADARASLDHLSSVTGGKQAAFIVGFCFGGSTSLYTGTEDMGLAGVIGFYAGLARKMSEEKGTVIEAAATIKCPVLGLFGGSDQGIPVEQVREVEASLDKAGMEHEIVIYDGAPHSFFDRRSAEFADASTDAWKRVLGFIATHSK